MANSFFDFDTSLKDGIDIKDGDPILPEDDDDDDGDGFDNEEEYDALNDETFGACGETSLDDWEQQHEEFAEINESSRHPPGTPPVDEVRRKWNIIEQEAVEMVRNGSFKEIELAFSPKYDRGRRNNSTSNKTNQRNGASNSNKPSIPRSSESGSVSISELTSADAVLSYLNKEVLPRRPPPTTFSNQPGKIRTVEELERNLLKGTHDAQVQNKPPDPKLQVFHGPPPNHIFPQNEQQHSQGQPRPLLPFPIQPQFFYPPYNTLQHQQQKQHQQGQQHQSPRMPPPGMPPLNMQPPNIRHLPPPHHMIPPGYRMMPPPPAIHPMMPPNGLPRPPGYMYPMHMRHNFGYSHPPPNMNVPPPNMPRPQHQGVPLQQHYSPLRQQQQQHNQQQRQRTRHDSGGHWSDRNQRGEYKRDEYAGLMTPRDKQWLLNIQMLQINTGTPYFDDFYYTIYKERKAKNQKENTPAFERNNRFNQNNNNNGRPRRNSERQQQENNLTPRVYTPLQFENSLGKLQCGSITAPRKIIDMDVVQHDKDQDVAAPSKESRKTKQYLLELEMLYSLLLKAEDIQNPLFISNMEKWRDIKQKQRLRELEQASTSEQKQEVLMLFKQESTQPVVENQTDYIVKICNGLIQEEKFSGFLSIRKGKVLLLRLLPHLTHTIFRPQLLELWSRVLLSLPVVGRRDTAGDNLLPKLYPYFKNYVETCSMVDIQDMTSNLIEVVKQENSRSTPLSHAGKAPLYFVMLNKFGVSTLVCLFLRVEAIFDESEPSEKQRLYWQDFLLSWAKHAESVSRVAASLETIPEDVFNKHLDRFGRAIGGDKRATLAKYFVDGARVI